MKIILSRCDRCRMAYLEEQHKTTSVSYTRNGNGKETIDLCDKCLIEIISSLANDNSKPLYIPGD